MVRQHFEVLQKDTFMRNRNFSMLSSIKFVKDCQSILLCEKTRPWDISLENHMIIYAVVLTQNQTCDRQTDGQTAHSSDALTQLY